MRLISAFALCFAFFIAGSTPGFAQIGTTYDVTSFGATGDGVSDDTLAVQSAVDAAGNAGGGTVYFPCGQYRLGATGPNRFYSAIQVTHDDITLAGESKYCAELLPGFTHGGVLVAACPAFVNGTNYGANRDCDAAQNLSNLVVRDLYFHDDAPASHCSLYSFPGRAGGCFSEESHGISVWDTDAVLIENNRFDSLGDESITLSSPGTVNANIFLNTPGIPRSGGAAIVVDGEDAIITNNVIQGTVADPTGLGCGGFDCINNGRGISIETNSGEPTRNVRIEHNIIVDFDGWYGILLSSTQSEISEVTIRHNFVDVLGTDDFACFAPERVCPRLGDTNCEADQRCSITWSGASGSPLARRDFLIADNHLIGGISGGPGGGIGEVTIERNLISGNSGRGLFVAGSPLTIEGNLVRGFDREAIYLVGLDQDVAGTSEVLISGNRLEGGPTDVTADDGISMFMPTGIQCGEDGLIPGGISIMDNEIIGSGSPRSLRRAIVLSGCTNYLAENNLIDFNGSAAPTASGISNARDANRNRIICPGSFGIISRTSDAIFNENVIDMCSAGTRGIFGQAGSQMSAEGNLILDSTYLAVDLSGPTPSCTFNTSRNTTSIFDRSLTCGTDGAGAGCTADQIAGGICDSNHVCNASDPGCSDTVDTDTDGLSDRAELQNGSHPLLIDTDFDGFLDPVDNCVAISNPDQLDTNGNGEGDACDFSAVPEPNFSLALLIAGVGLAVLGERIQKTRAHTQSA